MPLGLRRFVLCFGPTDQRNSLMFLARAAGYEALPAISIDDALRIADTQKGHLAAVLCCGLTTYDGGVLVQLRSQLAGAPILILAGDGELDNRGVDVVLGSESELVAYLMKLRHTFDVERAA